jgi:hypothetical protein
MAMDVPMLMSSVRLSKHRRGESEEGEMVDERHGGRGLFGWANGGVRIDKIHGWRWRAAARALGVVDTASRPGQLQR